MPTAAEVLQRVLNRGGTLDELLTSLENAGAFRQGEIKSSDFAAAVGHRYQVDTSGAAVIATLPGSANPGQNIVIEDAKLSWNAHNLTVNRNGLKINGATSNYVASTQGGKLSLVYIDAAFGWSIK
jgi:hypothetical protein